MRFASLAWVKAYEAAVIIGGISSAFIVGVGAGWVSQSGPVLLENPAIGSSYAETPTVRPGDLLLIRRSLRRLDTCAISAGTWLVTEPDAAIRMSLGVNVITSIADGQFHDARTWFPVPSALPPGEYAVRTYPMCDRNPLSQVQQQLQDIRFKVVAP